MKSLQQVSSMIRKSLILGAAYSLLFSAQTVLGIPSAKADTDATAQVTTALSGYHMTATTEKLVTLAGSEDALVAILLKLRTQEEPPFVGIRAERLLLQYASRSDVEAALSSDVQDNHMLGLARTVTIHIDEVSHAPARKNLTRMAVSRATSDATFLPYARSLESSKDEEVRSMARSLPK